MNNAEVKLIAKLNQKLDELAQINNDRTVITVVPPTKENGFIKKYYINNETVTTDRTMTKTAWVLVNNDSFKKKYYVHRYKYDSDRNLINENVSLTVSIEIYKLKNKKYSTEYLQNYVKLIQEIEKEIYHVVQEYLSYYAASERNDESELQFTTIGWERFPEHAKNIIGIILEEETGVEKTRKIKQPDGKSCVQTLNQSLGQADGWCTMMGGSRKKRGKKTRQNKKRHGRKSQRRT
jgi:hypothetical protein